MTSKKGLGSHQSVDLETTGDLETIGDLIFQDAQVQSKIDYINNLLKSEGIPFVVDYKSNHKFFAEKFRKKDCLCLCLVYLVNSETPYRWFDFKPFTTKSELLDQLEYIECNIGVLKAICTLFGRNDIPPVFDGFSTGEVSFSYFDFDIVIKPTNFQSIYSVLVSSYDYKSCSDEVSITQSNFSKVVAQSEIGQKIKLKVQSSEDNVKSSDLVYVIDNLLTTLVDFIKDKTPLSLKLG